MILSHIVACSENYVIGNKGKLPWHIPEDYRFFKQTTQGHTIIMGRKTYESLGKPLPNRRHIVITKSKDFIKKVDKKTLVVSSVKASIEVAKKYSFSKKEEVFIIGGGEIYYQTLDLVDRIYLTLIHETYPGDTFYPKFDKKLFKERSRKLRNEKKPFFTYYLYERFR